MTPVGRRPDDGERYRAILETAARLICERGYEGTSMQEIADACRLTKAGLYHYIQNKEQLLSAIMGYGMDLFENLVLAKVRDIEDPVARLRSCMRRNIELVTHGANKEVIIILHEHATLKGEAREYIDRRKKQYVRFIEETFTEAVKLGRMRPLEPTIVAFSFLGMVLWVYKWFKPDGRLTEEQIITGMVDLFFAGLAAPGAATGPDTATVISLVPPTASGEKP
jgi:AcrR family transcriptional regulator